MTARRGEVRRATRETDVTAIANLDGSGKADARTGVSFVDHLLGALGKHAMIDLKVRAKSADGIAHHLIEDTAIAVGGAIDRALGGRAGVARFAHAAVPMDEALAEAAVDLVKRPHSRLALKLERDSTEGVTREDLEHFFRSLLENLCCCAHLEVRYGDNDHHKAEAAMKALAVALRAACARDPRQRGAPSTKGKM